MIARAIHVMNGDIKVRDVVAGTEDVRGKPFEKRQDMPLRRGQIGTVVILYQDGACEVEFADHEGRTFAMLALRPGQLMILRNTPDFAAA